LAFFCGSGLARDVAIDSPEHEGLEGRLVDPLALVEVDRAARLPLEARVEEMGGILEGGARGEGELHGALVGLAGADDAPVGPDRGARPLELLDDLRIRLPDEGAHPAEGLPPPVPECGNFFRDEFRRRRALARVRLFHLAPLEKASGWPEGHADLLLSHRYALKNFVEPP